MAAIETDQDQKDELTVIEKASELLGEKFNPILCKARNAIVLQQLVDKQVHLTIKDNGNHIVDKNRALLVSLIASANTAMDQVAKHVCKDTGADPLTELLNSLKNSNNNSLGD